MIDDWFVPRPKVSVVSPVSDRELPEKREMGYAVLHSIRRYCYSVMLDSLTPPELADLDQSSLMNLEGFCMVTAFSGSNCGVEQMKDTTYVCRMH